MRGKDCIYIFTGTRLFHGCIHLTRIHDHVLSRIEISKPTNVLNSCAHRREEFQISTMVLKCFKWQKKVLSKKFFVLMDISVLNAIVYNIVDITDKKLITYTFPFTIFKVESEIKNFISHKIYLLRVILYVSWSLNPSTLLKFEILFTWNRMATFFYDLCTIIIYKIS